MLVSEEEEGKGILLGGSDSSTYPTVGPRSSRTYGYSGGGCSGCRSGGAPILVGDLSLSRGRASGPKPRPRETTRSSARHSWPSQRLRHSPPAPSGSGSQQDDLANAPVLQDISPSRNQAPPEGLDPSPGLVRVPVREYVVTKENWSTQGNLVSLENFGS